MRRHIRDIMNPALFHGAGKKAPYFEGWYYKIVSADERARYAVIPGISLSPDPEDSHAFIQVFDGLSGRTNYVRFGLEEFRADRRSFNLRIGKNNFTADYLELDISTPELSVSGRLEFSGLTLWPVTLHSPGIMGWYAWVPKMECFHGIVSLDHSIQGRLTIEATENDFTGGRGYTEKDWGRSFPRAWIWMQSNHFPSPGTSLTASLAIIPWIRRPFPGFIIGLTHNNHLYRFATYTGARVEHLELALDKISWIISDRRYLLEITAGRTEGGRLHSPTTGGMTGRIQESLNSEVYVQMSEKRAGKRLPIFEGMGRNAGFEASGDLDSLMNIWRRSNPGSSV